MLFPRRCFFLSILVNRFESKNVAETIRLAACLSFRTERAPFLNVQSNLNVFLGKKSVKSVNCYCNSLLRQNCPHHIYRFIFIGSLCTKKRILTSKFKLQTFTVCWGIFVHEISLAYAEDDLPYGTSRRRDAHNQASGILKKFSS